MFFNAEDDSKKSKKGKNSGKKDCKSDTSNKGTNRSTVANRRVAEKQAKSVPGLPWVKQGNTHDVDLVSDDDSEKTVTPRKERKRKVSPSRCEAQSFSPVGRHSKEAEAIKGTNEVLNRYGDYPDSEKRRKVGNGHSSPLNALKGIASPGFLDSLKNHRPRNDMADLCKKYGIPASPPRMQRLKLPEFNAAHVQEMRDSMAAVVDLCKKLEEENSALKDLKIREDIEQVIEVQNDKVREHGQAAAEVAEHWKREAEKLAAMIDRDEVRELSQKLRQAESRASELEMEIHDLKVSCLEKDGRITELQKRNTFLERYARVHSMSDKCVGTDNPQAVDVGVQAPHGIPTLHARSMAPEGAPASSLYTYGAVDAAGPTWGIPRGQPELTFDLQPQITAHHDNSARRVSGMSAGVSSWQKAVQNIPGTKESHRQFDARRVSALYGADGNPRKIEFYSGSGNGSGHGSKLATVREERSEGNRPKPMPSSLSVVSPEEQEVLVGSWRWFHLYESLLS